MFEEIQGWVAVVSTVLGILITLISLIAPLIKNVKAKTALQGTAKVLKEIEKYMTEAETFVNYTGAEKKEYVLTKAKEYAKVTEVAITDEELSDAIEGVIYLTKNINKKDTK